MVASPYDGLYWETHFPLGLYKSLQDLMDSNKKNPNTPNSKTPSSERQWLSLPRGANSYTKKHSIYTFADSADFFVADSIPKLLSTNQTSDYGKEYDYSQYGYGAQIARSLDPKLFNWFPIAYNSEAFPLNVGVEAAVDKAVAMILGSNSKVFLVGHGKGAVVTSKLYNEFRSGRLASRRANLLGVYNFGSPMREEGHSIPGGTNPGGHGIASERLTNTEDLVWEFASPDDPMASVEDDITGQAASLLYTAFDTLVTGPTTLQEQLQQFVATSTQNILSSFRQSLTLGQPLDLLKLLRTLWKEFFSDGGSHDNYQNFYPVAGGKMNAIEAAIISIQNTTIESPPETVNSSATEVMSVNYRQPVSISEISFEVLRKSSYLELWYLDRSNNWRQLLKENSSPITLKVGHSESMSWYKFTTYTYPVVAKAIQFRLTRVSDPLVGDIAYPVGIRNTLVRRNVYNRSSGLQHMEDETDALGNIVSKIIKDWDAAKAVDDNSTTFWRSSPQPDPNAVVCFYLDTRDSEGNAQLIDKVYLDPVYSGQSVNLYYSNDQTVTTKKLNPASLIPVPDFTIGTTLQQTDGSPDPAGTSGTGSTATLRLNALPNISVGDSVTVAGVVPNAYNGTHTLTGVSKTAPFSISYSSTATGSQTVSGYVTTGGQENFEWVIGKGLKDTVPNDSNTSVYRCPLSIGPMVSQDCWIGVQWTPDFDAYEQKSSIIPISTRGVTKVGSTANLQLSAPPNVAVGDSITVTGMQPTEYNGTHVVTSVSNSEPYRVSFNTSATGSQTQSGILVTNNFVPGLTVATTAVTGNGATATITLASNPKVVAGDLIRVSGVTPQAYNGNYTVTGASTSAPWTISFASGATGSQTVAGTVSTNTKVKIVGINSPSFSTIYSIYDFTSETLIYSRARDQNNCTYNASTKILRIPPENVPAQSLSSDNVVIYYGTSGPAPTQLSLLEVLPDETGGTQWWPRVFYNTSSGEVTLEILQPNGGPSLVHSVPLDMLFDANTTINIVAGWKYLEGATPTVYISARTAQQTPLALLEISSIDFPQKISFDGKIGFRQWRGTFGAHIVKQEAYSVGGAEKFLANPPVYCNPDPVLVSSSSTTAPANSLDRALMAADWTSQQFAAGGAHSSSYSDKEWTPIWVNYFAEKGFLYLPETTSMKYLKLEFSQLTPEPYPVYDQGIKVSYQSYPITVTQTSTQTRGLVGVIDNIFGGIGSVNWLNPSSVNQAVNSIFGRTVQPVQTTIQVGPGTAMNALPNTTQTAINESVRTEANSPWVYRRTPVSPFLLVQNYFGTLLANSNQGLKSLTPGQQEAIVKQTTINTPTASSPAALPIQGQDWYVFPGQTLRMPANVVEGVTGSQVVTNRNTSKATRTRFTTTAVHQYETKTVTLDANIAYFAGIREVQPYVVTYIDYEDPAEFRFDNYDSSVGWSLVNIQKVGTGPITANPNPYNIPNRRFNATINYWTGSGWNWDSSEGYSPAETWQPGTPFIYGSAHTTANGSNRSLTSSSVNVNSGAYIKFIAWAVYRNITYSSGAKIYVDAVGLDENDNVIVPSMNLGEYMEIKTGANQNNIPDQYFFPPNQPCSSVPQIGIKAIPLYGTLDLSQINSSVRKIRLRLNVNANVSGGEIWFDDIDMIPGAGIIGSVEKTITTKSKFSKVRCQFKDSGVKRSDPMWAFLDTNDPRRTILTHYTTTIPSAIPDGTWSDSFGTWADSNVEWGTPYSVVSVNYSEAVYDKKRVIHFFRKSSSLNEQTGQAGIAIRQNLNFVPGALFRICATFFKKKKTDNTMELRLTRVSGIEAGPEGPEQYPNGIIHSETLLNGEDTKENIIAANSNLYPTGRWHTHEGQWVEIPEGQDQVYRLEFTLSGNDEDDIFLNDLWVEIAHVRYYVQLGGGINHDVTPLVYKDNCTVGTTNEVTQMRVQVEIHGSNSFAGEREDEIQETRRINKNFAYSSLFTPLYLQ